MSAVFVFQTPGGRDELGSAHLRPRRGSFELPRRPEPQARVNEAIRASRVRLIGEEGQQLGIKQIDDARNYAYGKGLDLVEVAAQADPPVAKVMDYGKYRYEQEQKAKQARKNQTQIHVKELGTIEIQPLLEGRNMTMVLAPTKNAGVKKDAETEEKLGSEEEVPGDSNGEAPAPEGRSEPQSGAQVAEAEAGVPQG